MQKPEKTKSDAIIYYIIATIACVWIFNTCSVSDDEQKIDNKQTIEQKIERQFSAWNGYHRGLVSLTKKRLKDPDSFQHIKTGYIKNSKDGVYDGTWTFDGTITVLMEYRAKNGFGGYAVEIISAVYDVDGNLIKAPGTF